MHDDQHGTAIISGAALLNALEIQKKKIEKARFVVNGAGAAAMACVNCMYHLGQSMKISPCLIRMEFYMSEEQIWMKTKLKFAIRRADDLHWPGNERC